MADDNEEVKEPSYAECSDAIGNLNSAVGGSVSSIRKAKAGVMEKKNTVITIAPHGTFIRDQERIVLSAPEIVIGDVDMDGNMWQNSGRTIVIIRGNDVITDGVSEADSDGKEKVGTVTTRAPRILQYGYDAGPDGREAVVMETSEVKQMGKNISLYSTTDKDVWAAGPSGLQDGGVYIHADNDIFMDSSMSVEKKAEIVDDRISDLTSKKASLTGTVMADKAAVMALIAQETALTTANDLLVVDEVTTRTSILAIQEIHDQYKELVDNLQKATQTYLNDVSDLAEATRQLDALNKLKADLASAKGTFKDDSTKAKVTIMSETVGIVTRDGDGNIRENKESGIFMKSKKVSVKTTDDAGALLKDSTVLVNTEDMTLSTANPKLQDAKDASNSENTADGRLHITSKDITIDAIDYDVKDGKAEEKALAAGGILRLRAENITMTASDKDAKATGKVLVAAKDIEVAAFDLKNEEGKPLAADKVAAGGSLVVSADKVLVGSKSKDNKTTTMQVAGDKVGIIADTTAEMQQGEGKAAVTMDGGNASIGGDKTEIFSDTTINGKTEISGEVKVPKLTGDVIEASSAFKSPNIQDGMGAASGSSSKISAKLQQEEAS